MKILHLFNEINFSGAEIMYAQAAPLLQGNGFELIAVSTGTNEGNYVKQYQEANYKIYHKPLPAFSLLSLHKLLYYYKDFYFFLKQEKIDVLHIHRSNLIVSAFIAKFAKIKCIKTQHNNFRNNWYSLPYAIAWRFILRNLCQVTFQTIGESVYDNELNYYRNPSVRVNNWFDEKKFYPAPNIDEKSNLRKQHSIPQDAFVIVSTGSCSHVKNHHDIIKALALVKDKINVLYLHLGQGKTGSEEKQLALDLGVSELTLFLGNKNNVRDYLVAADIFVMTSKFEGLSIAAIEAMACKLPCILYNSPGLCDLIKNNDNGYLIKPDYHLLADTIINVRKYPDEVVKKTNHAYEYVKNEYSILNNVKKIIKLYKFIG